jgi:hypothetical protein
LCTTTTSCSIRSIATTSKQRLTLFLNPELLTQARAQAVVEGHSLTVLVQQALLKYLPQETIIKKPVITKFNIGRGGDK